uniref:Uncharacterized protein n=1 Tax=Panagrellus redivivus TaxID=6233 RepID=A0A7E4WCM1_PANRE
MFFSKTLVTFLAAILVLTSIGCDAQFYDYGGMGMGYGGGFCCGGFGMGSMGYGMGMGAFNGFGMGMMSGFGKK